MNDAPRHEAGDRAVLDGIERQAWDALAGGRWSMFGYLVERWHRHRDAANLIVPVPWTSLRTLARAQVDNGRHY